MNLIITWHHFGGQNQDHVYSPVCLIGHFGHNRVSFRALPNLLNNNLMFCLLHDFFFTVSKFLVSNKNFGIPVHES